MQRRQITLEDGRYLVFYTFEEESAPTEASSAASDSAAPGGATDAPAEPLAEAEPMPQATEERRV